MLSQAFLYKHVMLCSEPDKFPLCLRPRPSWPTVTVEQVRNKRCTEQFAEWRCLV